jgi:hypothetical protein
MTALVPTGSKFQGGRRDFLRHAPCGDADR